jgi:hypothetical protein
MAKNQERVQSSSFGTQLGLLYKRWTLDCVVTIAHAVSLDFSHRPELYQRINHDTATKLTDLQGSYGFQANFPDMNIRQRLMKPIFGQSDGHGSGNDGSEFQTFRLPVLAAAADFSENAQPTTFPSLRERVRNTVVPLKIHLADLKGDSLFQTERRTNFIFDDIVQTILKDRGVDAVFGIVVEIDPAWPLESTDQQGTAQGAKLIEKITTQLTDLPYSGVISREMFVHMQRMAEKGFQSIRIILDETIEDPQFDIDPLITELYAWGSELRLIGGNRPLHMTTQTQPIASMAPMSMAPVPMAPMSEASTTRTTAYGR